MNVGRDFFDLQLCFAGRAAEVAGVPLETALLDYTNLYVRFGLGRAFDPDHPQWQAYLDGLRSAAEAAIDWTDRYYRRQPDGGQAPGVVARAGCFAYARLDDGRLRLHFENVDPPQCAPLGRDRAEVRRVELTALIDAARRREPANATVVGLSWLYNLPAYRRLFPAKYLASARPAGARFRNMPLWGQFLDRHGGVRPAMAAVFKERLVAARTPDDLAACFPFQPLMLDAPLADFG